MCGRDASTRVGGHGITVQLTLTWFSHVWTWRKYPCLWSWNYCAAHINWFSHVWTWRKYPCWWSWNYCAAHIRLIFTRVDVTQVPVMVVMELLCSSHLLDFHMCGHDTSTRVEGHGITVQLTVSWFSHVWTWRKYPCWWLWNYCAGHSKLIFTCVDVT